MPAQPQHPERDWPDDWNEEGTLWADASDHADEIHLPAISSSLVSDADGPSAGVMSNWVGRWAETAVDFRVSELGGVSDKASADDQSYDRIVRFGDGDPKTVQIKYAGLDVSGKAQFNLGPRVGRDGETKDGRRFLSYRKRADVFILVTRWKGMARFYVIPAGRLEKRVSLTITPSLYRQRRTENHIEPEWYVEAWKHLGLSMKGRRQLETIFDYPTG